MMAAEAAHEDDEIFVYMGGNQFVPDGTERARIHNSVTTTLRQVHSQIVGN